MKPSHADVFLRQIEAGEPKAHRKGETPWARAEAQARSLPQHYDELGQAWRIALMLRLRMMGGLEGANVLLY